MFGQSVLYYGLELIIESIEWEARPFSVLSPSSSVKDWSSTNILSRNMFLTLHSKSRDCQIGFGSYIEDFICRVYSPHSSVE